MKLIYFKFNGLHTGIERKVQFCLYSSKQYPLYPISLWWLQGRWRLGCNRSSHVSEGCCAYKISKIKMEIAYISLRISVMVHLSFIKAVFSCGLIAAWKNKPKKAPNTPLENNISIKLLNLFLVCYSSIKLLYQIVNFLFKFCLLLFPCSLFPVTSMCLFSCCCDGGSSSLCLMHVKFRIVYWTQYSVASCEHQSQMASPCSKSYCTINLCTLAQPGFFPR